jgi:hypothetical protein
MMPFESEMFVSLQGGAPSAAPAKQLSSKVWEKVVPLLKVEGMLPCVT